MRLKVVSPIFVSSLAFLIDGQGICVHFNPLHDGKHSKPLPSRLEVGRDRIMDDHLVGVEQRRVK